MTEEYRKDREPWSPRIEKLPLFINSADYERGLSEIRKSPSVDISEEEPEEGGESVTSICLPGT
jgi:hypothetical protein